GAALHRSAARGMGLGRRAGSVPEGARRRGRARPDRLRRRFPVRDRRPTRHDPDTARRRGASAARRRARAAAVLSFDEVAHRVWVLHVGSRRHRRAALRDHPRLVRRVHGAGALERDQFIQRHCYACNEYSGKFFVNDRENPYSFDPDKPFHWILGRQVGGRSIMWGRQVYRWSDLDFGANARDGFGVDWPIRYADIAPWYDYVEEFIGISGEALGLPQLPDGKFLPPMALNCAEQVVREGVAKRFGP